MEPLTALAALAPILVQAGKAAISRWVAPSEYKPATVDEYVSMKKIDLDMFIAMNNAGGTNPTYPWVEAAIRLMRPAVASIVLGTWGYIHINGGLQSLDTASIDNFASAIGFYLFGDRTLFYANKSK